ncbi:MAG: hypothetical protein P8Y82_10815, partial [Methyloceanibacter sp.]
SASFRHDSPELASLFIPGSYGALLLGAGKSGIGNLRRNDQVAAEDDDCRGNSPVDQRPIRLHELEGQSQGTHLIAFETVMCVQREELRKRQSFLALGIESVVFHERRPGDIG